MTSLPVMSLFSSGSFRRLKHQLNRCRQVSWIAGTVDNESLNKKKSKCCCIYVKPSKFGESEEEDDDECENCRGHGSSLRRDGSLRSPPPEPEEDPSQPGTSGRKPTLMPCIKKVLSGASIENAANKKERK